MLYLYWFHCVHKRSIKKENIFSPKFSSAVHTKNFLNVINFCSNSFILRILFMLLHLFMNVHKADLDSDS